MSASSGDSHDLESPVKHNKIFQQHTKTKKNIMLLWYEFKL